VLVKLLSSAGTGYFYVKKKNPRVLTQKLAFMKYDPRVRKHVLFTVRFDRLPLMTHTTRHQPRGSTDFVQFLARPLNLLMPSAGDQAQVGFAELARSACHITHPWLGAACGWT